MQRDYGYNRVKTHILQWLEAQISTHDRGHVTPSSNYTYIRVVKV